MKAIDKSINRIRAEDVQAAALWTLPVVKGKHVVALQEASKEADSTVPEDKVVVEKITLSELEKISENAYQEGREQGVSGEYTARYRRGA